MPPAPPPTTLTRSNTAIPPPPPTTSSTSMRVNLQTLANDYASETLNRKKQTKANVNKAYSQILQNAIKQSASKDQIIRSRPNSPELSIILTKKSEQLLSKQGSSGQISRNVTQNSILRTNPISSALKTAKSKNTIEPMFISIASSIEPASKLGNGPNVRVFYDHYNRKSSLHNPSLDHTTIETPMPSRLY